MSVINMALTIPTVTKENFEFLNENMDLIAHTLTDQQKAQIAQFAYEKQQAEEEKKLREVLFRANHPKLAKAKDVITKGWEKLIRIKWFDKIGGFLKKMATNAVGWLQSLIGIVILLKSGILQEMLPWIMNIAAGLITTLIKWTPTILKFIWHLVTRTLPKLLKGIFNTIFDTLGLPKDHPIRKFFNYIFDNFPKFMDWLLSILIKIKDILVKIGGKIWEFLKPVVGWLGDNMPKLLSGMREKFSSAYSYLTSEEFLNSEAFQTVARIFKKLLSYFESLYNAIKNFAIDVFGSFITFFQEIKTLGFKEALKNLFKNLITDIATFIKTLITDTLPKYLSYIWEVLKTVVPIILTIIGALLQAIWELTQEYLLIPIWNGIKAVGRFLKKIFIDNPINAVVSLGKLFKKFITKTIPGFFKKLIDKIKSIFTSIGSAIERVFDSVFGFFKKKKKDEPKIEAPKVAYEDLDNFRKFMRSPGRFISDLFTSLWTKMKELPKKMIETIRDVFDWIAGFFRTLGDIIDGPIKGMKSRFDNFSKLFDENIKNLKKEREQASNIKQSKNLGETGGKEILPQKEYDDAYERAKQDKSGNSLRKFKAKFIRGEMAKGGPVSEGDPYIIGEKGTELYIPNHDGNIAPNNEIKDMVNILRAILKALENNSNGSSAPSFIPFARTN